jgi:hypothetical protein
MSADLTLTQDDVDSLTGPRRRTSGRRRFANTCVHRDQYKTETGTDYPHEGCPKFAHLPGNGRGPQPPSVFRTFRVIAVSLIKPLFYFGLLYVAYILLSGFLGGLSFGGFVPGANSGMSADIGQSPAGNIPANSRSNVSVPPGSDTRANDSVVSP